jgi:hypothetical protein
MKRIVETTEQSGLEAMLGENVLLMCGNYFYAGRLVGVNESHVELAEPSIVYETGAWNEIGYSDAQRLHAATWNVQLDAIESFGESK